MSIVVGLILSSLSSSIYLLYFTYSLLIGFGGACTFASHFIMLRKYFKKHYSLAMGIRTAGAGVGVLTFGPFVQHLIDLFGWENTFRIFAGIFAALIPFAFIMDPNVEQCEQKNYKTPPPTTATPVTTITETPPTTPLTTPPTTPPTTPLTPPLTTPLTTATRHVTATAAIVELGSPIQEDMIKPRKIVLGFVDLSVWTFPEFTVCVIAIFFGHLAHYTPLIHMVSNLEIFLDNFLNSNCVSSLQKVFQTVVINTCTLLQNRCRVQNDRT